MNVKVQLNQFRAKAIITCCLFSGLLYATEDNLFNFSSTVPMDTPNERGSNTEEQLAIFAWQQFIALCWKSDYDENTGTGERGMPSNDWQLGNGYANGDSTV